MSKIQETFCPAIEQLDLTLKKYNFISLSKVIYLYTWVSSITSTTIAATCLIFMFCIMISSIPDIFKTNGKLGNFLEKRKTTSTMWRILTQYSILLLYSFWTVFTRTFSCVFYIVSSIPLLIPLLMYMITLSTYRFLLQELTVVVLQICKGDF